MPSDFRRVIYWDSCIFLSHINGMKDRIQEINDVINEINANKDSIILTSSESIVEVAHSLNEKENGRLDPNIEIMIDEMWDDSKVVKIIDNGKYIAKPARELIRKAITNNWSLKPKDAIHLASAMWHDNNVGRVNEFQTYDKKLNKFHNMIGIPINPPHVMQFTMKFDE